MSKKKKKFWGQKPAKPKAAGYVCLKGNRILELIAFNLSVGLVIYRSDRVKCAAYRPDVLWLEINGTKVYL